MPLGACPWNVCISSSKLFIHLDTCICKYRAGRERKCDCVCVCVGGRERKRGCGIYSKARSWYVCISRVYLRTNVHMYVQA